MRVKKPDPWVLSPDGESFAEAEYPSKAAAVAAGAALGTKFTVGQLRRYEPTILGGEAVDAVIDLALEELDEETVGDWLSEVPDAKLEVLEVQLSLVFRAWLKENGLEAPFHAVVDATEHTQEEALEAQRKSKDGSGEA